MQGSTEQQQLKLITQLCGAITPLSWPCVERLELYGRMEMPRDGRRRVKDRLRPYVKDQGRFHLRCLLKSIHFWDPLSTQSGALHCDCF